MSHYVLFYNKTTHDSQTDISQLLTHKLRNLSYCCHRTIIIAFDFYY